MRRNRGFTLLEMLITTAVLSVVMLMMYGLMAGMTQIAKAQEAKVTTQDDARNAMLQVVRELRQSARGSINWNNLPTSVIQYRVPMDLDGNGTAVDVDANIELSPLRTIMVDANDVNQDGQRANQLVLLDRGSVRVLSNSLQTLRDVNGLSTGFTVVPWGTGLRVNLLTEREAGPANIDVAQTTDLSEVVVPRN